MMKKTDELHKIKEIFHYFNIQADVDSVYGNWVVSENGDVVNFLYPYVIFAIHLDEEDWLEQVQKKAWFVSNDTDVLKKALDRADKICFLKMYGDKN